VDITLIEEKDRVYVDNWGWNYSVTGIDIWLQRYTTPFLLQFYLVSMSRVSSLAKTFPEKHFKLETKLI
jgi:hypothetical protein